MKPHGYQRGHQYPLVLYIHGGPHTQYGHIYFHEFQMLAGQGYWVLFTIRAARRATVTTSPTRPGRAGAWRTTRI